MNIKRDYYIDIVHPYLASNDGETFFEDGQVEAEFILMTNGKLYELKGEDTGNPKERKLRDAGTFKSVQDAWTWMEKMGWTIMRVH